MWPEGRREEIVEEYAKIEKEESRGAQFLRDRGVAVYERVEGDEVEAAKNLLFITPVVGWKVLDIRNYRVVMQREGFHTAFVNTPNLLKELEDA